MHSSMDIIPYCWPVYKPLYAETGQLCLFFYSATDRDLTRGAGSTRNRRFASGGRMIRRSELRRFAGIDFDAGSVSG